MKKFATSIPWVIMAIVFTICGCQQNPNSAIIASKNDGSFSINSAKSSDVDHNPDETQLAKYTDSYFSTDGTVEFLFSIDEEITAANMPVIEVTPHYLTEEDAKRVAFVLFGDATYFEAEPILYPNYSKSDIREKIERWSVYTNTEALTVLYGTQKDEDDVELVKSFIKEYTTLYALAPEDNPHIPCQWKFQKASIYKVPLEEVNSRDTSKDNDEINAEVKIDNIRYKYTAATRNMDDYKLSVIFVSLYDGIGPDMIDSRIFRAQLSRTEEPTEVQISDVRTKAEKMLEQIDLGEWKIDQCFVETTYYGDVAEYIICVNAVPVLNGIPAIRQAQLTNLKSQETYSSNLYLTDVNFQFSANGDLIDFELYSPLDIKDVVNDNVAVLSMDEMMEKAKHYLAHSDYYEYGFGLVVDDLNEEIGCTVDVCKLEYNLIRVKVPNTDESYYYVPGVTLLGNIEYYGKDSGDIYFASDNVTLVTLNSIDGSVINATN